LCKLYYYYYLSIDVPSFPGQAHLFLYFCRHFVAIILLILDDILKMKNAVKSRFDGIFAFL